MTEEAERPRTDAGAPGEHGPSLTDDPAPDGRPAGHGDGVAAGDHDPSAAGGSAQADPPVQAPAALRGPSADDDPAPEAGSTRGDARADAHAPADAAAGAPASAAAPPASGVAAIRHQVMWNRLVSVVEEQAQALIRTAFSTSVREAGDLSAGVYDARARMLAQAVTGTPGHVNAMADAVAHFVRAIPEMREGDVYLTNDPWMGTGHLHDVTVVTPAFRDGRLAGFLACTAHVVDIGGRGFGADADSVYEEGLRLPIMHLAREGVPDEAVLAIVRANVREPDQVAGDVTALTTCNAVGVRRLMDMMDEFGLADLEGVAGHILGASERAVRAAVAALPDGEATAHMAIDGHARPVDLRVRLTIEGDAAAADFDGTSAVDPKGINVPLVYTKAYACYALKCAIAPEVPNNAGSLAPFAVTAPECIVAAPHPAPVALRHVIGHMIPDVVFGALDALVPETVPAEGAGALCNLQLSLHGPEGRAEVLMFNSGGSGARPGLDGLSATAFPSGVMTMPVEATEAAGPAIVWRKELRPDSGGPGRQRGGLGQLMELGPAPGHACTVSLMLDRVDHPARGRRGGGSGAPTRVDLDGPRPGKGRVAVPEGARLALAFPGGGGYGPPSERDRAAAMRDVALGYVTPEAARRDHGLGEAEVEAALAAAARGDLP